MAWERELQVLNEAIRRLNAEYDAFLYGSVPRPPVESRRHVDEMFRRLGAAQPDSAAERYQFSALQGRFYSLCERWERLQAEKEAGRRPGIHGGFVPHGETEGVHRPNAPAAASVEGGRRTGEASRDRALFEAWVAAKRRRGEEAGEHQMESFLARLEQERENLKRRVGDREIEFEVVERDGRVKLVAKPSGK